MYGTMGVYQAPTMCRVLYKMINMHSYPQVLPRGGKQVNKELQHNAMGAA